MRAVVQRVTRARVTVHDREVGVLHLAPGAQGLVALLGVSVDDDADDAAQVARKVAELRILDGERSASDAGAPVLVVSQFTLLADTRRGRRPSWSAAARGPQAEPLVAAVVDDLRRRGLEVATGTFGADMAVELVNDGPVTIVLDTR